MKTINFNEQAGCYEIGGPRGLLLVDKNEYMDKIRFMTVSDIYNTKMNEIAKARAEVESLESHTNKPGF